MAYYTNVSIVVGLGWPMAYYTNVSIVAGHGRPEEQVFRHIPTCAEWRVWTPDPWITRQIRYRDVSH